MPQGLCVLEPSSSHLSCPQARKQAAPANLPVPGECCQGTWPHALETLSGASTVQFTPLCDLHPGASKQTKAHTGGVTGSRSQQEGDFSKVVLPPWALSSLSASVWKLHVGAWHLPAAAVGGAWWKLSQGWEENPSPLPVPCLAEPLT